MKLSKQTLNLSIGIILLGLLVRLPSIFFSYQGAVIAPSIYESRLVNNTDAIDYLQIAENLVEQGQYSIAEEAPYNPDLKRVPGYPLFLMALYIVAGGQHSVALILASNLILSLINIWLIIQIGSALFTRELGHLAGLIYAIAAISIALVTQAMSETLFTCLLLTSVYLVLRLELQTWRQVIVGAIALAFLMAISSYVRAIAFYILPIFLLSWIWRNFDFKKNLVLVLVSASLFMFAIMPWYLRNYQTFGAITFSSVSDGNLLTYNAASVYAQQEGLSLREAKDALNARVAQFIVDNPNLDANNPAVFASIQRHVALDVILGNPLLSVWVHIQDSLNSFRPGYSEMNLVFFDLDEAYGNNVGTGTLPNIAELSQMQILIFGYASLYYGLLYLATVIGLGMLLWQRQWHKLLLLFVLPYWFVLIPSIAGNSRFRVPIEGFMAILMAYACASLWQALKQRKEAAKISQ